MENILTLTNILPIGAAGLFFISAILIILNVENKRDASWVIPAMFCGAFSIWTLLTVIEEGLMGFWREHIRNMWGNQIWFDLLLAIGLAFLLVAPRAKALGMKLPLWIMFIMLTGSIGLSAMVARYLYLDRRHTKP